MQKSLVRRDNGSIQLQFHNRMRPVDRGYLRSCVACSRIIPKLEDQFRPLQWLNQSICKDVGAGDNGTRFAKIEIENVGLCFMAIDAPKYH